MCHAISKKYCRFFSVVLYLDEISVLASNRNPPSPKQGLFIVQKLYIYNERTPYAVRWN